MGLILFFFQDYYGYKSPKIMDKQRSHNEVINIKPASSRGEYKYFILTFTPILFSPTTTYIFIYKNSWLVVVGINSEQEETFILLIFFNWLMVAVLRCFCFWSKCQQQTEPLNLGCYIHWLIAQIRLILHFVSTIVNWICFFLFFVFSDCTAVELESMGNRLLDWFSVVMADTQKRKLNRKNRNSQGKKNDFIAIIASYEHNKVLKIRFLNYI